MSTQLVVAVPQSLALPAHLMTPEAAQQIAAANAAAAGGIKTGGFPKISIEGGKFHEVDSSVDGGSLRTYMVPAASGQPPLPMMCLEAVVIAANPALVKTFYVKKWQKGDADAPDCKSSNGVTPDADIAAPQSSVCATCPQNQWGSRISEATGKEVKACTDSKQMVVLPGSDLTYKALGLAVTPAALGDWGKYVKALSDRNIPVNSVVTNVTFDHTASFPKLQFAYNRFLTADEYAQAVKRADGDDVKLIVSPTRRTAALPAPAAAPALAAPIPVQPTLPPVAPPPAPFIPPPAPPPAPIPMQVAGFGAVAPPPSAPPTVDPFGGHPPHVATAVNACGGLGTQAGLDMYKALTGAALSPPNPATPAPATEPPKRHRRTRAQIAADEAAKNVAAQPTAPNGGDNPAPEGVVLPAAVAPPTPAAGFGATQPAPTHMAPPASVTAPVVGFGAAAPVVAPVAAPSAATVAAGMSLRDKLLAKLGVAPAAG